MGEGGGEQASSSARKRRRPDPSPLQRALGLLTRREHSRQELARKLASRGVEAVDAAAAIDRLAAAGWQDDARFAASVVRSRAAAGYGPAFVRAELRAHGLGHEVVAGAMEGFEGDWLEVARALARRRHPGAGQGGAADARKAMELLLRRGFSLEQARAAIGRDGDCPGD